MNQLGGVGAGGIPGRSYAFAPGADGLSRNELICGNPYCKELHNITLTNEELLFLANKLLIANGYTLHNANGNIYLLPDFYGYPPNLVRKLEIYKKLYLQKSKNSNMNLNDFYKILLSSDNKILYSFIMTKISNDKSYKYNQRAIDILENIIYTMDDNHEITYKQKEYLNINNDINFWKEIFRYLHWYICK